MGANAIALMYLLLLLSTWLLVPLVPAWATYRITPDQRIAVSGPFQGFTWKMTGAAGVYVLLLFITYKLVVSGGLSIIGGMTAPAAWTFRADVVAINEAGQPVPIPETVHAVDVAFTPSIHRIGKSQIVIKLPYDPDDWPFVTVTIPQFGGAELDLSRMKGVDVDSFKKTV